MLWSLLIFLNCRLVNSLWISNTICNINLGQQGLKISLRQLTLKNTLMTLLLHISGTNELSSCSIQKCTSVLYSHIYPGNTGTLFPLLMFSLWYLQMIGWPVGCVRLFADYTISLSSLCKLIWRHWTTKMFVWYMLPSVCLRLRRFSQLSFIRYMGLCVFSLPNSPVMILRMCTLSYFHHQTGSMNH